MSTPNLVSLAYRNAITYGAFKAFLEGADKEHTEHVRRHLLRWLQISEKESQIKGERSFTLTIRCI